MKNYFWCNVVCTFKSSTANIRQFNGQPPEITVDKRVQISTPGLGDAWRAHHVWQNQIPSDCKRTQLTHRDVAVNIPRACFWHPRAKFRVAQSLTQLGYKSSSNLVQMPLPLFNPECEVKVNVSSKNDICMVVIYLIRHRGHRMIGISPYANKPCQNIYLRELMIRQRWKTLKWRLVRRSFGQLRLIGRKFQHLTLIQPQAQSSRPRLTLALT